MDALQTIYVYAQLALELDDEINRQKEMNHVFDKLDQVGRLVEEKMEQAGARADAFLARGAAFDEKLASAFRPHDAAFDAGEAKLAELERKLDRLSNAPLAVSKTVSTGSNVEQVVTTENPT